MTDQPTDPQSAEAEHRFHNYTGNAIPWYVRLIWIGFWVFAVYYVVQYLFPSVRVEMFPGP